MNIKNENDYVKRCTFHLSDKDIIESRDDKISVTFFADDDITTCVVGIHIHLDEKCIVLIRSLPISSSFSLASQLNAYARCASLVNDVQRYWSCEETARYKRVK